MKNFLILMLSGLLGQISSKRVCGVLGWLASIGILLFCSIKAIQAPDMINAFMLCCMGLLGIDSVTSIWKS